MPDETKPPATTTSAIAGAITGMRDKPAQGDPWVTPPAAAPSEDGAPVDDALPEGADPWAEPPTDEVPGDERRDEPGDEPGGEADGTEGAKDGDAEPAEEPGAEDGPKDEADPGALPEPVTLTLPPFGEGDEPLEVPSDDPVVVARLNDLVSRATEAAATVETARGEVEEAVAERDAFLYDLRVDPVRKVIESLGDSLEARKSFALQLLADDELRQAVLPDLEKWDEDPREKELAQARFDARRDQRRQSADQWHREQRFTREWNRAAFDAVLAALPSGLDSATRALCVRDAMSDIQQAINANNGEYIDPSTIPAVLQARTAIWRGIAGANGGSTAKKDGPPAKGAAPSTPPKQDKKDGATASSPAAPTAAELERARRTPEVIRRATLRRRTLAASVAPTRAATPRSGDAADISQMNTKEVIAFLKGSRSSKR